MRWMSALDERVVDLWRTWRSTWTTALRTPRSKNELAMAKTTPANKAVVENESFEDRPWQIRDRSIFLR